MTLENLVTITLALSLALAGEVLAQNTDGAHSGDSASPEPPGAMTPEAIKAKMLGWLPESVSDGLDLNAWSWLAALRTNHDSFFDAELSVEVVKSFDLRAALAVQVNFLSANGDQRVELGHGYLTTKLAEDGSTLLTVGKFNANFGVESRDFWDRRTGTTSLLFGAQPQDLVGAMVTLTLGDTGIKVRPFVSADFQGQFYFDQPPSGGVLVEFKPCDSLELGVTNWVGPGLVLEGGRPLHSPYPRGGYGTDPEGILGNWQGPNLVAERAGTLYFVEARATWRPRDDLSIYAEYLMGTTDTEGNQWGWQGFMVMADFSVTDTLHTYGRWSWLDDKDWLITGFFQLRQEVSVGFGWRLHPNIELRAEYRHDFSDVTPGMDVGSVHLALTF